MTRAAYAHPMEPETPEPSLDPSDDGLPTPEITTESGTTAGGTPSLAPLWSYAVFGAALLLVVAAWLGVRVQVRQLRVDLAHLEDIRRHEVAEQKQLLFERANRRRVLAMEAAAEQLSLVPAPRRGAQSEAGSQPTLSPPPVAQPIVAQPIVRPPPVAQPIVRPPPVAQPIVRPPPVAQ